MVFLPLNHKYIDTGLFFGMSLFGGLLLLYFVYPTDSFFTEAELDIYNYTGTNILVIKPLLTANAYRSGGFYDCFKGDCDESCLSVQIDEDPVYTYDSSLRAIVRFEILGATMADDYHLDPTTLKNYDKIVLLHNEYVTQEFYDGIIRHPNVFYMYPNALYGKVSVQDGNMTLIQGHGYKGIDNGFGWKYDNTRPYESDNQCKRLAWNYIYNGIQLNCYPENFLMNNTWIFGDVKYYQSNLGYRYG